MTTQTAYNELKQVGTIRRDGNGAVIEIATTRRMVTGEASVMADSVVDIFQRNGINVYSNGVSIFPDGVHVCVYPSREVKS